MTCQVCGSEFERTAGRGPVPRYCSAACRQSAYRQRHARTDTPPPDDDYVRIPRDEYKWLYSCKTSDSDKVEAELVALRALKARVDGCRNLAHYLGVHLPDGRKVHYSADLLAWLRGDSDD